MNSPTHLDMGRAETVDRSMSQTTIEGVARDIGRSVAQSVIHRIQHFPEREALLFRRKIRESSLPEQILWDGLGEEAAPVFVVYKLIHEALSNAPQFFRAALVAFMQAQPERFSACFSRETIWSVMAAFPSFDPPEAPLISDLREMLSKANNTGIWWRTDWEIMREAQALQKCLDNGKFGRGFLALKALQSEKARGIACGKLLLAVPGRLAAYAQEVVGMANEEQLPPLAVMHARVDEIARDKELGTRHESIPLDLLYTTDDDDILRVRILVRAKAGRPALEDLRRRSLFIRYFLRKAFTGYDPGSVETKIALYLDDAPAGVLTNAEDKLFYAQEVVGMREFWAQMCHGVNPDLLFRAVREEAAALLQKHHVVHLLRAHFNSPRPDSERACR